MGRDLRIIEPSGIYHVISRGNNRTPVLGRARPPGVLLRLDRVAKKYEWLGLAYCLMTTHYHLLVQLPEDGLSAGMQELNGEYARRTSYRHRRVGHLFQNRFYSDWITSERHLFGAIRYIALNPVRAGICADPAEWPWSSHRASAGLEFPIGYLALPRLLNLFDPRPVEGFAGYCRLVHSGRSSVSDTGRKKRGNEAKARAFASQVLR
jgi:putative transposase